MSPTKSRTFQHQVKQGESQTNFWSWISTSRYFHRKFILVCNYCKAEDCVFTIFGEHKNMLPKEQSEHDLAPVKDTFDKYKACQGAIGDLAAVKNTSTESELGHCAFGDLAVVKDTFDDQRKPYIMASEWNKALGMYLHFKNISNFI